MAKENAVAVFGGGCFWCTEAAFAALKGIHAVAPGYAGGEIANPTYEQVCGGQTGHAEVVKVEYNPAEITYEDLLTVFFTVHDPTTMNRQGHDVGTQYRSVILTTSPEQDRVARQFVAELQASSIFDEPIITEVKPLEKFYNAEAEHRQYYQKNPDNPYCQVVINPKLKKLKERYSQLLKPGVEV